MARADGFYKRFSESIAPSIFGNEGASLTALTIGWWRD